MVTAEHISIVISALRELYEFIIVDTHSSFTEVSIAALDAADLVLLVTTLELPALKSVKQFMDTATQKLGYSTEKIALVVNRASAVGGLSLADVETSVGTKVVATVASQGAVAVDAANQGVPFVISNKESQLYKDMVNLATLIAPSVVGEQEDMFANVDLSEAPTLGERIRSAPAKLRAAVAEGVSNVGTRDVLFGLGSLFAVSAPFMLVFALLGFISRSMDVKDFPANPAFNLAVWAGILGGTWLVDRLQEPRKFPWVLGAILGAAYGLAISFASFAVLNVAGGVLNTPPFYVLVNLIPYAVLGILGTLLAERTRPQVRALLRP